MKKNILIILGAVAMTSPVAPTRCVNSVNVGLAVSDKYGNTASVTRSIDRNSGKPARWDVLVSAGGAYVGDGKQVLEPR